MKDEALLTEEVATVREVISPQENSQAIDDLSKMLAATHDQIGTIVDIDIEGQETRVINIFKRGLRDYVNGVLGINIDPAIFAQMTDTLNKQRRILESGTSDNFNKVPLKKAA